jgi:hypothetical protein
MQPLGFGLYALLILLKWAVAGLISTGPSRKGTLFSICYAPKATKMCTEKSTFFSLCVQHHSFSKFLAKLSSDSLSSDSSWP